MDASLILNVLGSGSYTHISSILSRFNLLDEREEEERGRTYSYTLILYSHPTLVTHIHFTTLISCLTPAPPNHCPTNTGELIIKLAPQIVINTSATDLSGQPLVMETYNFSVKDVFEAVTIEEYLM
jgi:hypothetical protein